MPTQIFLIILFIVATIAGAIYTSRLVMTSRKPGQRSGVLSEWSGMPLPSWKYESYATTAMLIHIFAVLVLAVAALRTAANPGILNNPLFANDISLIGMVWFIQCGCISLIGYQLGAVLNGILLIGFRKEPVAIAITEKGVLHGKNLLPWSWFSHFTIDNDSGILILYSAFSPDLASLISKLPESVTLVELSNTMHKFLPFHPPEGKRAWYRMQFVLIPAMLLVCFIVVTAGCLVSRLQRELALFLIVLLMSILIFSGGRVITLFAFGVLKFKGNLK
jgi:hypothetical protein